jgi:hypothetical protein
MSSDCLVLHISEIDSSIKKEDTSVFIIYDVVKDKFHIRGKRRNIKNQFTPSYEFQCDTLENLLDFFEVTLSSPEYELNITIYNYNDLSLKSEWITYDYLMENKAEINEIVGYDNKKYSKKYMKRLVKILMNVYNYY